jgi:tetratricopeptide (TPR) repeat protein
LRDYRNAIEDYSRALALKPDDAQIYGDRAAARAEYSDLQGAIKDYQQAANLWFDRGEWQSYGYCVDKIKVLRTESEKRSSEKVDLEQTAPTLDNLVNYNANASNYDRVDLDLQAKLLQLVGGNEAIAQRLINIAKQNYPDMPEQWYWQKVIFDIESE